MDDRSRYVYLKEVYNYLNDYFCDRIKNGITGSVVWEDIHQALKDIPAADVVKIVRCKDCIRKEKCPAYRLDKDGEWFCADGERKS